MDPTQTATIERSQPFNTGWDDAYKQDAGQGSLWQENPIPCLEPILAEFQAKSINTIAEVGCGDGRNTRALIKALPGVIVAGVEVSETALLRCGEALREAGQAALLLKTDGVSLPFAANSLDALLLLDVFGQLAHPEENLAETRRVLKPGGLIALNAFTVDDETFGEGEQVAENTFNYKGTLFRYFEEPELRDLLHEWNIVRFERQEWDDPPHGDFRPVAHRHVNWVVIAQKL